MSRLPKARTSVLFAFVLAAALSRLLPHPPNFSPVGAIALFAGAQFGGIGSLLVPLGAMLVSDTLLELAYGWGFHPLQPVVYGCLALTVLLGRRLTGGFRPGRVLGHALLASVLFFVVTNAAVWVLGGNYPRTLPGLGTCYIAALPFFQNTLLGNVAYSMGLFGGFALVQRRFPALAPKAA